MSIALEEETEAFRKELEESKQLKELTDEDKVRREWKKLLDKEKEK